MTRNPRILVGVTTYEKKDYAFDLCMKHIANIDYDNFDTMIVDNTKDLSYFLKLKRRGYKNLFHVDRGANSREALTKAQNRIRQHFLEGGYDYLLFVESDLFVPRDTIKRLLSHEVDVVGSVYFIGIDYKVPCIFMNDVQKGAFKGTRPLGIKIDEDGRRLRHPKEVEEFLNRPNKLQQVHGCGFGCTLIARRIVEKYPFWCDERLEDKHSDVYFYLDLLRDAEPVFVDISTVVPHEPTDWAHVRDR